MLRYIIRDGEKVLQYMDGYNLVTNGWGIVGSSKEKPVLDDIYSNLYIEENWQDVPTINE